MRNKKQKHSGNCRNISDKDQVFFFNWLNGLTQQATFKQFLWGPSMSKSKVPGILAI